MRMVTNFLGSTMLTTDQQQHFLKQGFLVVENVLDPQRDLAPVIDDYAALLDQLASEWCAAGRLRATYRELPFVERLTKIMAESAINVSRYFDISLPDNQVAADEPMHLSEPLFKLITNPRLLDVVECFVGPEILSNPVQHVRIKPPEQVVSGKFDQNFLVRKTGWHQDQGVIRSEADETPTLTVWLPINEATTENGCLCVVPGSHRAGLAPLCPGDDGLTIPDRLLAGEATPVPLKPGSVLLLHRLTQHASLSNRSQTVRWSLDLRYQPIGLPTGREEYPGFVARSRANPALVLTSFKQWEELWRAARERLASAPRRLKHRWSADAPICA